MDSDNPGLYNTTDGNMAEKEKVLSKEEESYKECSEDKSSKDNNLVCPGTLMTLLPWCTLLTIGRGMGITHQIMIHQWI